jgi:proline iminopeptidase
MLAGGCESKKTTPVEGLIDVTGGKVWYRIYGDGEETPILLLHGGPGSSSYSLEPLKLLGSDRPVILFDQLGSGRSTRITDTTLMTIDHYVEQLEQLRAALKLEDFCLYGHSWGTMLGIDYYLKYPDHVNSLIFNSPLFSTELWIKDADTLIATLPDSVQTTIRRSEANKTFDNTGYQDAIELYYSKFLRRKPRSQAQVDSAKMLSGDNIYEFMWGPSEFTATGNLLDYDRLESLPEISVPVLYLTGEYDEARPGTVAYYQSLTPNSTFEVIKNSGHVTMHDNLNETITVIRQFLERIDTNH